MRRLGDGNKGRKVTKGKKEVEGNGGDGKRVG